MTSRFFVNRQGSLQGPLTSAELKKLAARGELDREDLLRRDEEAQWIPAAKYKGLFETVAADDAPPPAPAPQPAQAAAPAPPPAPQPAQSATSSVPDAGVSAGEKAKAAIADQIREWRPLAERYSKEFELGMNEFLAVTAGAACLVLLVLSTLVRWEKWTEAGAVVKTLNWKIYGGLDVLEGKLVCLLAVIGLVAVAAPFVAKKVLPISLIVGAAVGVCSVLLTLSYMHQISAYQRESDRQSGIIAGNFERQYGEKGGKDLTEMLMPTETDTPGFGLYLSFLCSVIVAATFVFASLSKPVAIPAFQKETVHPFARTHGALLIAVGAAFIFGMADYVLRY